MSKKLQVLLLCIVLAAVAAASLLLATDVTVQSTVFMDFMENSLPEIVMPWGTVHIPLAAWYLTLGWSVVGAAWCFAQKKVNLPAVTFLLLMLGGLMVIGVMWPHINKGWDYVVHIAWVRVFSGMEGYTLTDYLTSFNTWFFGYAPYTAGAAAAHLLGFSADVAEIAGMVTGVVVYAGLCSAAVAAAPKYKVAFMAASMVPTALFQAANITYDAPIIACMLLGTALLLRELHTPDKRLEGRSAVAMTTLFTLGTIAKPTYSLSLLLLWLLPGGKFAGRKQRIAFCLFVAVLFAACAGSMALGMYDDQLDGDDRMEGSDPAGQIAALLDDPIAWLSVLGNYLLHDMPDLFLQGGCAWAYFGTHPLLGTIVLVTLLLSAFVSIDEKHASVMTWRRRVWIALAAFLPLLGLILAQYLVSTPVGSMKIVGMQSRYVLPVLIFVALALALPDKWRMKFSRFGRIGAAAVTAVMLATVFISGWMYCIVGAQGVVFP